MIRTFGAMIASALVALPISAEHAGAAFPGEPGLIAFVSTQTNTLRLIDPAGSASRRVPNVGARALDPAWSPGGRWLMYTAHGGGVWIIRPDGSQRRRIAPSISDGDWSPDGQRVVFASAFSRAGCTDIHSMRLNGRELVKHTTTNACEFDPSFSPDGKRITFTARTEYATHVVIRRIERNRPPETVIVEGSSPDWAPDGRSIAYARGTKIVVSDVAGRVSRELELVTADRSTVFDFAWSPNGGSFVVEQGEIVPPGLRGAPQLFVIDADGSNRRQLTFDGIDANEQPVWQPVP